jgi:hypothetical protein
MRRLLSRLASFPLPILPGTSFFLAANVNIGVGAFATSRASSDCLTNAPHARSAGAVSLAHAVITAALCDLASISHRLAFAISIAGGSPRQGRASLKPST